MLLPILVFISSMAQADIALPEPRFAHQEPPPPRLPPHPTPVWVMVAPSLGLLLIGAVFLQRRRKEDA